MRAELAILNVCAVLLYRATCTIQGVLSELGCVVYQMPVLSLGSLNVRSRGQINVALVWLELSNTPIRKELNLTI